MSQFRVGVDIGGTFTDIVFMNDEGRLFTRKVSSSVDDYARAIAEGLTAVFHDTELDASSIDEVLHGTNSRERIIGAKAVVEHLVERGALGAVSSHDLGLVDLAESTAGQVRNVHFEDHIEGGEMRFDYTMKDGPVGTSNALRLMRQVGIDLPALNERLHPNVVNPPTP